MGTVMLEQLKKYTLPTLRYLEFHLTDHCNLNCKGCAHFSPVADDWYADIDLFIKDLDRLGELFRNIRVMRLMGGEPLLHDKVIDFIEAARRRFPRSNIRLVTNGSLLDKMDQDFWRSCRRHNIDLDITVYPPVSRKLRTIYSLGLRNRVIISVRRIAYFIAVMNFRGDSDPRRAFNTCRKLYYCPYLKDGKLYVCALAELVKYMNDKFNLSIPTGHHLDIHRSGVTGHQILNYLEKPIPTCRFCSEYYPVFKWARSRQRLQEWDVETYAD